MIDMQISGTPHRIKGFDDNRIEVHRTGHPATPPPPPHLYIEVRVSTEEGITSLHVSTNELVRRVKVLIQDKITTRDPLHQLEYAGALLDDDATLAFYNIQAMAVLTLTGGTSVRGSLQLKNGGL